LRFHFVSNLIIGFYSDCYRKVFYTSSGRRCPKPLQKVVALLLLLFAALAAGRLSQGHTTCVFYGLVFSWCLRFAWLEGTVTATKHAFTYADTCSCSSVFVASVIRQWWNDGRLSFRSRPRPECI
jgi:hypothetical protein